MTTTRPHTNRDDVSNLDRLREEYEHALRSTYVSRDANECGRTYDLVDEAAADALLTQMQAERDEARSELEAIHALASSVPGMDPQDHETAMSVAEAMRAVIVQQAGDLERLRCGLGGEPW